MMEPALFSAANLFDAHSSGTFFFLPSFLPYLSLIHSSYDVWCLPPPCIVSLFLCFLQHVVSAIKQASRASEMMMTLVVQNRRRTALFSEIMHFLVAWCYRSENLSSTK
jgi:cellulose synthase/poly-beta-1,6-N-acetylglucosamine synthase-like glycosyltransferase